MKKSILLNALLKYIIIFFFAQDAFCQIPINVIESNELSQIKIHDTIFQKFSGNVIIDYYDLRIICDTILIDEYKTLVKGFGYIITFSLTSSIELGKSLFALKVGVSIVNCPDPLGLLP